MPYQRAVVPPSVIAAQLVMGVCAAGWGALGVLSFAAPEALSTAAHRYVGLLLATATLAAMAVYLTERVVTAHRAATSAATMAGADDGYATGYAAGLGARPGSLPEVARLVRTPR